MADTKGAFGMKIKKGGAWKNKRKKNDAIAAYTNPVSKRGPVSDADVIGEAVAMAKKKKKGGRAVSNVDVSKSWNY
jgi:hypothetical protein